MASFSIDADRTPFGKNVYLRSTKNTRFETATASAATMPSVTIDGSTQKVLQPGTVMARITAAGAEQGKVGPFDPNASDGREDVANVVGVNDTFLPWQLLHRDVPIGVLQHGTCEQAWCFEYASGVQGPIQQTTVDALRGTALLDINFA